MPFFTAPQTFHCLTSSLNTILTFSNLEHRRSKMAYKLRKLETALDICFVLKLNGGAIRAFRGYCGLAGIWMVYLSLPNRLY